MFHTDLGKVYEGSVYAVMITVVYWPEHVVVVKLCLLQLLYHVMCALTWTSSMLATYKQPGNEASCKYEVSIRR